MSNTRGPDIFEICEANARDAGRLADALIDLVEAVERLGIRETVAGWNGENRPELQRFGPHPDNLLAVIPTNCGTVCAIDKATVDARKALGKDAA